MLQDEVKQNGLEEQKVSSEGDREACSHCTDSLTGRNGYGKVGRPVLGRRIRISKDAELRGLLCVEGPLSTA